MAFLSQASSRRSVSHIAARPRISDAFGRLTFFLAIGFAAALVFGLISQ
jgi:hypothetical protein